MVTIYDLVEGTIEHIRTRADATTAPQAASSEPAGIDPALQPGLQPALSPTAPPAAHQPVLFDVNRLLRHYER